MRRRTGLSQRELAKRAGVAVSCVIAVEAGRRSPSLSVLTRVLDVAALELSVDVPAPELDACVLTHLRLSLVRRLHLALGGRGRPYWSALAPWDQLVMLARRGDVLVHGDVALGVWLPTETTPDRPRVCIRPWSDDPLPRTPDVDVRTGCNDHVRSPVRIAVTPWTVCVDPPADLALNPEFAMHRQRLRAVARLLHSEAARDAAGRRTRAHRDPDHEAERAHVFHTKRFGQRRMPDSTDVRSWRLGDDASLVAWLRTYDYPV